MENFRIVLLDNAKAQLDNPYTKKVLGDMMVVKQKNFERSDENYISLDKHDMIGTHVMIYDTTDLFDPKMVFALRLTYQDRAEKAKIRTPIQDLYQDLNTNCKYALDGFLEQNRTLVECNALFSEADYSAKKIGIKLSDWAFVVSFVHLLSNHYNYLVCCPNKKYKTHRYLEDFGYFSQDFEFIHPKITDPHMLVMMSDINIAYIARVYNSNPKLFESTMWMTGENGQFKNFLEAIKSAIPNLSEFLKAA